MDALTYIGTKFGLNVRQCGPIEIPNMSRDPGLARLFYLLGFQAGVEVGTEQGLFAEALCRENPGLRLTCVDPWKAYVGYRDHVDQEKLDGFYDATKARLAPYNATLVRQFSRDAARNIKDGSLDFVYLDGNHAYEHVVSDLASWTPKVRPGGIIAGHDYVKYKLPNMIHVVQAIDGWTSAYEIAPWFLVGTQAKVDGEARDNARSWFWVNEPKPAHRKKKIKQ